MIKQFLSFSFLIFSIASTIAQSDTDVLMTVNGTDVTVGEFKYIYEKNNGDKADYSRENILEYLDLYKKFKLKVARAYDMKLDTIDALQKELDGYRSQLANSYLTEKGVVDKLVDQLYERKKEDVLASHILIKINPKSSPSEKKQARKKLENLKQQMREGKSFAELAKLYSEDTNTKNNGGSLGFITAALPNGFYELENALYDMDEGEVSDPVETRLGLHLVKVIEKRPARGKIEVAHIFKKMDKTGDNPKKIKETIDSIYTALENGANFINLVKEHSEDKTTANKGGRLPVFGIAVYDSEFENAAFAHERNGDYTRPIRTSVGYHIIKRINKPAPENKETLKLRLKDKLVKQDRYESALNSMIEEIKKTSNFIERPKSLDKFIATLDESFYTYKWKPSPELGNEVLVTFDKNDKSTLMDFALFAKSQTRLRSQFDNTTPLKDATQKIYEEFIKEKAYEYERANLEAKYPDFNSLMREYREGILLFEATKINVWDKANQDTVGLYEFYEKNKSKYIFEQQATIGKYIINTTDEKKLKKIKKYIKRKKPEKVLSKYNKDDVELIEFSKTNVEPGHKDLIGLTFQKKSTSDPAIDKNSRKSLIKKVLAIEASRRKTLSEAKGYVIADYQDQLEKKWVKELKNAYPLEVNEEILNALIKN